MRKSQLRNLGIARVKFTPEQSMKAERGVHVYLYFSLTLALDWCGWPMPHSGRFTPGKDPVPIV